MKEAKEITGDEYDYLCKSLRLASHLDSHLLRECDICGDLVWVSSGKGEKIIRIETRDVDFDGHCSSCYTVAMRNPEVFSWVLNVISKHKRESNHENH